MSEEVKLPKEVQDVHDELARIKKKIEILGEMGGDVTGLTGQLETVMGGVVTELITEAGREISKLGVLAHDLNWGIRPPAPDPNKRDDKLGKNEDIERLDEVNEERKRIAEKLKIARKHREQGELHDENDIVQLEKKSANMDADIRKAAIKAAERELEELEQEIEDINEGRPNRKKNPRPDPNAKKTPEPDPDPDPNSGSGSGSGGGGGSGGGSGDPSLELGIQEGEARGKLKGELAKAPVHYVKSETQVWGWDARNWGWIEMDFETEIVSVEKVSGGLLAISKTRAALFDSNLAKWLPALDLPGGTLDGGG